MTQDNSISSQKGLSGLLRDDNAWQYYQSLPDYVREMISQRGSGIHTEEELRRYADSLLTGD